MILLLVAASVVGLAAALVMPHSGPSAAVRNRVEAFIGSRRRPSLRAFSGVTNCVLCTSVHLGAAAAVLLLYPLGWPAVLIPGLAALIAVAVRPLIGTEWWARRRLWPDD